MPLVTIELWKGRSLQEKNALMSTIHSSVVETLKVGSTDCSVQLIEIEKENCFDASAIVTEKLIISLRLYSGRSAKTKKELYHSIASKLKEIRVATDNLTIVLIEIPLENWSLKDGIPANEMQLGFKIDV